jgi:hypothetical protein
VLSEEACFQGIPCMRAWDLDWLLACGLWIGGSVLSGISFCPESTLGKNAEDRSEPDGGGNVRMFADQLETSACRATRWEFTGSEET